MMPIKVTLPSNINVPKTTPVIQITAINKKYQSLINRLCKWDARYNDLIDALDGDENRHAEQAYDKAACIFVELPKREQANIQRYITGY